MDRGSAVFIEVPIHKEKSTTRQAGTHLMYHLVYTSTDSKQAISSLRGRWCC